MTEADLAGALALSTAAGWNQTEDDWRIFLREGSAWGIAADGALAASAAVLPHGPDFAWVSMVLTLPGQRRRGFGTALMAHALATLAAGGYRAMLDATPLGEPIYATLGFSRIWGFRRFRLPTSVTAGESVRALRAEDWPSLLALDGEATGMQRAPLLRALAARVPGAAFVTGPGGRIDGFVFARDGRLGPQIGPVVARDAALAWTLIASALGALPPGHPAVIDIPDRHGDLQAWLSACGAEAQRPFTRMARGEGRPPGNAALVIAPAGPEFG